MINHVIAMLMTMRALFGLTIDLVGGRVQRTVETDGRIISYCAPTGHIIGILIIQGHVDDDGDGGGHGGFEGVKVEESEYCFYRNLPENPSRPRHQLVNTKVDNDDHDDDSCDGDVIKR